MSDIQILIENIRKCITFPETVSPDQMQIHARHYAELCTELNRRMMQCVQQIRAGNIPEGIRLAEMKPNLTELYLSLDIPEWDDWNDIISTLGFDVPPPFPAELFRELNEAYLKLSPLEPLLRLHRLHALNGSPIRERLAYLRAIAKNDVENIFWREDQEVFEKARMKELNHEIQHAIESKDFRQIRSLHAELCASGWIQQPPLEYRRQLTGAVLQNEADLLMEKFSVFEYEEASDIYDRMQQILASERMVMPPEVWRWIHPAILWLGETQRQNALQLEFHRAVADLQDALDNETALPDLERLYYVLENVASQTGVVIPVDLENLYHTVVSRLHTSSRRRNQRVIVSIIAVCLLAGGLLAFGLHKRDITNQVKETCAALEKFETEMKESKQPVEDLRDMLERHTTSISPKIINHPKVVGIINRLESLISGFEDRSRSFRQYHDLADSQFNHLLNRLGEQSDFSELKSIRTLLAQIEKLVRTAEEEAALTDVRQKHSITESGLQTIINDRFSTQLGVISDEYKDIESTRDLPPPEALACLEKLDGKLNVLLIQSKDVSAEMKEPANRVADSIHRLTVSLDEAIKLERAMQSLFSVVPKWTDYQSALQKLTSDFPSHPIATDAADVLKELGTVQAAAKAFQDFADSYTGTAGNFKVLQQEAASLKKKYDDVSKWISGTSNDIFLPDDMIENLSKMPPYFPGAFQSVEAFLKDLAQRELYPWIDMRDGAKHWYYLTTKPTKAGKYKYVTAFRGVEKDFTILSSMFSEANIPVMTQYGFARDAQKRIDAIHDDAVAAAEDILRDLLTRKGEEPGIDPILQCIVMTLLIKDMSKMEPFFASNFAEIQRFLQGSGIDQLTRWMDVQQNTAQQRTQAENAISRCSPKIQPAFAKTLHDREEFLMKLKQFQPRIEWVGVLIKKDGEWDCVMKTGSLGSGSGNLYIFRQSVTNPTTVEPIIIGQVSSGKFELRGNASSLIPFAPVFWVQN